MPIVTTRHIPRIPDPEGFLARFDDRKTNLTELAKELGISRPTLYSWAAKVREQLEQKKTPPPPDRDEG